MAKPRFNRTGHGSAIAVPTPCVYTKSVPVCNSRAFTLIELLVVMAITAVLAGLLLTALSQAKGQAQSAYCKNNLRQQGIGIQMYVNDSGFYPYYETPVSDPEADAGVHWEITLEPYYPAPNAQSNSLSQSVVQNGPPSLAYQCPAYASMAASPYLTPESGWWNNWSYGYNTWGSTYGAANVPNMDYCLGPGVNASYLWELISEPTILAGC